MRLHNIGTSLAEIAITQKGKFFDKLTATLMWLLYPIIRCFKFLESESGDIFAWDCILLALILPKLHNCVKRGLLGKTDQCKLCQYIVSHHAKIFSIKLCGILRTFTENHNHITYSSWDTEWDILFCYFGSFFGLYPHSLQRVQTPTWKRQSRLRSHFPPEMTLLKAQEIFHTWLKSNFLFTPILNIYFKRFSRWPVNNMQTFTDKHLLIPINQQVYKFSFVYALS